MANFSFCQLQLQEKAVEVQKLCYTCSQLVDEKIAPCTPCACIHIFMGINQQKFTCVGGITENENQFQNHGP